MAPRSHLSSSLTLSLQEPLKLTRLPEVSPVTPNLSWNSAPISSSQDRTNLNVSTPSATIHARAERISLSRASARSIVASYLMDYSSAGSLRRVVSA